MPLVTSTTDLRHQLAEQGVSWLAAQATQRLASGVARLDRFFQGGLAWGQLSEWGLPLGREGRRWVLPFVKAASQTHWCLWVSGYEDWRVFPPAFFAQGANPRRLVFAQSAQPVKELHAALIHPLFKLVVLDGPKDLKPGALAFIEAKARQQGQALLVLRPYLLSNDRGNVWAKVRVNGWREPGSGFHLQRVRGLPQPELRWSGEL